MMVNVCFVFLGRFQPARFMSFARHRAERLDLTLRVGDLGSERIEMAVEGQADLVDAFEMACSLGPIDDLVLDVTRAMWPLPLRRDSQEGKPA